MKIKINDIVHFTLKQNKPYSASGKVKKIYWSGKKRQFEVTGQKGLIFLDEITKVN